MFPDITLLTIRRIRIVDAMSRPVSHPLASSSRVFFGPKCTVTFNPTTPTQPLGSAVSRVTPPTCARLPRSRFPGFLLQFVPGEAPFGTDLTRAYLGGYQIQTSTCASIISASTPFSSENGYING
ncbi:hypothetical protein DTO271G3_3909 [Paecilomyces variotii]|nr:hypothetical protein DTO271G3_3909 [Paecilomyces variotii]